MVLHCWGELLTATCILPRMVFVHHQSNGGRKLIRPIIEEAVATWTGE